MNRPRRAFTLIELLVVISILTLLLTLLMPAVLKARQVMNRLAVKAQVSSIGKACDTYYTYFNAYPGAIADPPDPPAGGSPPKVSGSQNLRLSLLGCSKSGNDLTREYQGPAKDMKDYTNSRRYKIYTHRKSELVAWDHGGDYRDNIEIYVDYRLSPPRPILYFRALPQYVNVDLYEFDDNQVYCTKTGENSTAFDDYFTERKRASTPGYLLLSAGPDRTFFNQDDIDNVGGG